MSLIENNTPGQPNMVDPNPTEGMNILDISYRIITALPNWTLWVAAGLVMILAILTIIAFLKFWKNNKNN